ncbi:uncharacterized protein [Lepisosteus oculatus]|uniref:uncharacterized protein n=1 Tax=Lepisosteus oculatus TaxID=7918 RepID=UPI00371ACFF7
MPGVLCCWPNCLKPNGHKEGKKKKKKRVKQKDCKESPARSDQHEQTVNFSERDEANEEASQKHQLMENNLKHNGQTTDTVKTEEEAKDTITSDTLTVNREQVMMNEEVKMDTISEQKEERGTVNQIEDNKDETPTLDQKLEENLSMNDEMKDHQFKQHERLIVPSSIKEEGKRNYKEDKDKGKGYREPEAQEDTEVAEKADGEKEKSNSPQRHERGAGSMMITDDEDEGNATAEMQILLRMEKSSLFAKNNPSPQTESCAGETNSETETKINCPRPWEPLPQRKRQARETRKKNKLPTNWYDPPTSDSQPLPSRDTVWRERKISSSTRVEGRPALYSQPHQRTEDVRRDRRDSHPHSLPFTPPQDSWKRNREEREIARGSRFPEGNRRICCGSQGYSHQRQQDVSRRQTQSYHPGEARIPYHAHVAARKQNKWENEQKFPQIRQNREETSEKQRGCERRRPRLAFLQTGSEAEEEPVHPQAPPKRQACARLWEQRVQVQGAGQNPQDLLCKKIWTLMGYGHRNK